MYFWMVIFIEYARQLHILRGISHIPLSFSDKHVSSTKNTYKWAYERLKEWDRRTRAYNVYPSKNTEIYYFDTAEDILNDFPEEFI